MNINDFNDEYILINKDIINSKIFKMPREFHLYFYCLIKANYCDVRYKGKTIKKGELICTLPPDAYYDCYFFYPWYDKERFKPIVSNLKRMKAIKAPKAFRNKTKKRYETFKCTLVDYDKWVYVLGDKKHYDLIEQYEIKNNYIALSRNIIDEFQWRDVTNTMHFYIYFLLIANERGEVYKTYKEISNITGLSKRNVRTSIRHLSKANDKNELTIENFGKSRKYTILDYNEWVKEIEFD